MLQPECCAKSSTLTVTLYSGIQFGAWTAFATYPSKKSSWLESLGQVQSSGRLH